MNYRTERLSGTLRQQSWFDLVGFGMVLAIVYFVVVYRMFRGKVTLDGGGYGH